MSFGIDDLVAVLGFTPTAEQLDVITADLDGPLLVVAGAGSGKTTVMTARVIWAVAHGFVKPDQVLGLTFTTKAAAELSQRMRSRLARLRDYDRAAARTTRPALDQDPTSATYHSFANRIVSEHGLRIGIEPDAKLLTAAELGQLAYQVVIRSQLNLALIGSRPADVASRLIQLDGRLTEHSVLPEQLAGCDSDTVSLITGLGKVAQPVARTQDTCRARIELARLVTQFRVEKRRLGLLDFADLLRHGLTLVDAQPAVRDYVREQHRMVLLDEYQDTSHVQTRILARLFGEGHPVTAVGDPVQGIFGWRGASAESISEFPAQFVGTDRAAAPTLHLSVNHRSVASILAGANRVAEAVRRRHPTTVPLVPRLPLADADADVDVDTDGRTAKRAPRRAAERPAVTGPVDHAVPGPGTETSDALAAPREQGPWDASVRVALFERESDEVEWLTAEIARDVGQGVQPGDIAVLCRTGASGQQIGAELAARGIPVQVATTDGLFAQPEVIELLSVLRALADPTDNRAVLRLLRGPRWRIGARDLAVLGRRAKDLADAAAPTQIRPDSEPSGYLQSTMAAVAGMDPVELPSLSEAVGDLGAADRYQYSPQARTRLDEFAAELAALRSIVDLPLPELAARVISVIGLDVELSLRRLHDRLRGDFAAQLVDQFVDLTGRFRGLGSGGGLGAFLTWVSSVQRLDCDVDVVISSRSDAVQVLTVHRAKGLEWDRVFVPFVSDGVFPTRKPSPSWLTDCSQLPNELRGDRRALPSITEHSARGYERFRSDSAQERDIDERQLAYVALTRARSRLAVSAHWWGPSQQRARGPSQFLLDLRRGLPESAVVRWEPAPPDGATNPALCGVAAVEATPSSTTASAEGAGSLLAADAHAPLTDAERLIVAELDRHAKVCVRDLAASERSRGGGGHVDNLSCSTSTALSLLRDPKRHALAMRRPIPPRPSSAARDGTTFHAWVEDYYGQGTIFDAAALEGSIPSPPPSPSQPGLAVLREGFWSLEYADQVPCAVEVPFSVIVGGHLISGRIDAVFETGDGWEVVDWKTGALGIGDPIQLAIYRIAWAQMIDVAPARVTGAFAYVAHGQVDRFDDLPEPDRVAELLDQSNAASARQLELAQW